jgi:tetratricopeptide (TPR) repeat protein
MSRCKKWGWLTLFVLLTIAGCDSADTGSLGTSPRILQNPPYAGLTDSIKRFPDNAALYLQRALLLSQGNRHEMATTDYKKSWELKQDESTALEYVSNLLMVNRVDDAIALLQKGIKRFPHNPEFSRRLSEVYAQTGRTNDALQQYNTILETDSTNFEIWYDKGMLLAQLKDTAGAIQALEKSFSLQPINYSGLALASFYTATKNPRALEICDFLLSSDTLAQQTDPIYMKGVYYSETNQYDKALEQFDECIKRDWKMIDAYIEKGIVLYDQKKYEEALKIFNLASTVSNTNADAYFWIARCYEAMGKKEESIRNYERAISLDRSFAEAWEGLQRLK